MNTLTIKPRLLDSAHLALQTRAYSHRNWSADIQPDQMILSVETPS
ncbi:MAG: hypothetical protein ABSE84_04135 [Isosphaeraceae bacterium]|jgi:hypothetical protein